MLKNSDENNEQNPESAEAILENVFGESLEVSPNRSKLPDRSAAGKKKKNKTKKTLAAAKRAKPKLPKRSPKKPAPAAQKDPVTAEQTKPAPAVAEQAEPAPAVQPVHSAVKQEPAPEIQSELAPTMQLEPAVVPTPAIEAESTPAIESNVSESNVSESKVSESKVSESNGNETTANETTANETNGNETTDNETGGFSDLPLCPEVQTAIKTAGYQNPTPIQAEIIPHLLYGRDVLAQSQTGSGKTAAFALPVLTRIENEINEPQVLVLVPTRELAIQVGNSFQAYGSHLDGFKLAIIYGGQDYQIQYRQLRKGPQVIVGTPGRVIDHIKNGKLDISEIECLVLDEADEMLNMGFIDDVEFVLGRMPEERQIALFSATLPDAIRKLSSRYLNDPAKVTIKQKTLTADSIRQRAVFTAPRDRVDMLVRFLEAEEADGAIVFTRTRETTSVVADKLSRAGLRAFALNGEMPQKARERTIEKLKSGQLDILVATDIAARGLDVSRISHVFNYDLPEGPEAYTHRIGRTGRAGKTGEAIIFVSRSQQGKLKFIEKTTRQKIEIVDPPTADQINKMRVKRFYADIDNTIANRDMHFFEKLIGDYIEQSDHEVKDIAAAIAMIGQNGRDFLMKDRPVRERKENSRGKGRTPHSNSPEPGMARFRISVGKQDGVRPGNIVGAVTNEAEISGEDIGSIRIYHSYSTVDMPADRAEEIMDLLSDTRVSGRAIQIRPYEERQERPRKPKRYGNDERSGRNKGRSKNKSYGSRRSERSESNRGSNERYGKQDQKPSSKRKSFGKKVKAKSTRSKPQNKR